MTAPIVPSSIDPLRAIRDVQAAVATVIHGKNDMIELAVITMLAGGHLLLEDLPGVGKSTLARSLAQSVGGEFRRIQFTSDLLPGDLVGINVWRPKRETFEFREGPLFGNFVLADEINRSPPRTQSALLEAMGERQISVDGVSRPLPAPFMVIATQNPLEHHGTYPLPESQRDRFLLRLSLGYASPDTEAMLLCDDIATHPQALEPVTTPDILLHAQTQARAVAIHRDLGHYAQAVVQRTRSHPNIRLGVSTRGALAWVRGAKAKAMLSGRPHVTIDDLQDLAVPALAHRLVTALAHHEDSSATADELIRDIIAQTPVPT